MGVSWLGLAVISRVVGIQTEVPLYETFPMSKLSISTNKSKIRKDVQARLVTKAGNYGQVEVFKDNLLVEGWINVLIGIH
jgi:hypothetical protein